MSLSGLFSKVSRNCLIKIPNNGYLGRIIVRNSRIWEPDYLILGKTKTPEYDIINVQIKSFDFAVLEKFQKLICKIAKRMKINNLKAFPVPQQDLEIHHYKPNSVEIEYKYDLKLFERNVQVVDVRSHIMSLFIEAIITACPPGVNISFHEHEDYMEDDRYVPNLDLLELQGKLENMNAEKQKK